MFIFFLSLHSLHLINCVCRVSSSYELLFSFTYIQLQFPFLLFFYCLLEFRHTFFSECQVQLPSIWQLSLSFLIYASYPDCYPDRGEFSYTVLSLLTLQVSAFCDFARDATLSRLAKTESKNNMAACECDSSLHYKVKATHLKAECLTAVRRRAVWYVSTIWGKSSPAISRSQR
jgi:hypothetical protein